MEIKLKILDKKQKGKYLKPIEYNFNGNYALEIMFFRLSEIYFGQKISLEIERIIKKEIK